MKKLEEFIVRQIADEYIMMPVGNTAIKFNGLVMANSTSAFIWENIEKINTVEEMTNLVCEEFDVEYEEAFLDISTIMDQMKKAGWIEI